MNSSLNPTQSKSLPLLPAPYAMCSANECRERQEQHQVSEWEATFDTRHLPLPTQRILDPRLAVAKYRRSAAGSSPTRQPRSLEQLQVTWRHLRNIVCHQALLYSSEEDSTISSPPPPLESSSSLSSLKNVCAFVDDRIRAIQVDLVMSQQACSSLQLELIKYQVLCCYLLSELPRQDYEPKFARQALGTALVAYWNPDTTGDSRRPGKNENDDEVLCITALCHLATCLIQNEQRELSSKSAIAGGVGWQEATAGGSTSYGAILQLARHCKPQNQSNHSSFSNDSTKAVLPPDDDYPKFQYALQLVSASVLGMYRNVLAMLKKGNDDGGDAFYILCRACMAPALNILRLGALRHYNVAFGKREKITGTEARMARLLILPSAKSALEFASTVGLPVDFENCIIVMKAAPICVSSGPKQSLSWSRTEDVFVFGAALRARVDESNNDTTTRSSTSSRIDIDGVLIPPPSLLESLITTRE